MRKCLMGLLAGALLLTGPWTASAAVSFSVPDSYQPDGRLVLATEPDTVSDYVSYYQNGEEQSTSQIPWEDGREGHGQAISLDGEDDYLSIGYSQLRLTNFTVSLWVNWRGAAGSQSDDQQIFTIAQDENNYIALSTHHTDSENPNADGEIANGLFLDVMVAGEQETAFRPSQPNVQTSLPEGEWHHIAVVARQPYMTLYVDGVEWAQALWGISLRELNPNYLRIGGGMEGEASLNALIDDVEVYGFDVSSDQLQMLAAGVDPLAEGATVPPSTTGAQTTRPFTTTTTGIDPNSVTNDQSLHLALTVGGCGLGIFLLLTLGSLLFGKKKPQDPSQPPGGTTK